MMTPTMPGIAFAYKEISRFSAASDYRQEQLDRITGTYYIKHHPTPLFIGLGVGGGG